jgi:hypothetical protein
VQHWCCKYLAGRGVEIILTFCWGWVCTCVALAHFVAAAILPGFGAEMFEDVLAQGSATSLL